MKLKPLFLHRQKGIAAILILLLTGLSLTAMVYGAMAVARGTQNSVQTTHSATQAQLRAWTGAEVVRKFLEQFGSSNAQSLANNYVFTITGLNGVRAQVISKDLANSRITVNITGCSNTANTSCIDGTDTDTTGATSTIQLVYEISGTGGSSNPVSSLDNVINIKGNLRATGDIIFRGNDQSKANINVDGWVDTHGSLTGINSMYSTGTMNLTGSLQNQSTGIPINLASDSNISTNASGRYGSIQSLRDVSITGGSINIVNIRANGNVSFSNSVSVSSVSAIGNVTVDGNAQISSVRTKGNTILSNGLIKLLRGEGDLTEYGDNYVEDGIVGGTLNIARSWKNDRDHTSRQNGLTVALTPLTSQSITQSHVDANGMKDDANYLFYIDGDGRTKVKVSRVSGISNGEYFLYTGNNNSYKDWICTEATPSASVCKKKIGMGFDPNTNNLIRYNSGTKTWTLNGRSLAPGVAWFDGNLVLQVGTFYNTFIATGNITTAANINSHGINYGGYSNVCTSTDYSTIYPTNYCNKIGMVLTPDPIGNIGLLAGSYDVGHYLEQNYFRGGVITLAAGSYIYGDLIAGDYFTTSGDAHIFGYIVAANQSRTISTSSLGASTTIDLTSLTGYDPSLVDTGGGSSGGTPSAKILWSRYL